MPPDETRELILGTISPKDKPWDNHRLFADKVQSLYLAAENDKYADRMTRCAKLLEFAFKTGNDATIALTLRTAHFCRVRHCPVCQWRRSMKWTARMFQALPAINEAYPKHRWMFLTLTVKNCPIEELRSQLSDMNKAFKRLTQLQSWPATGWVKSIEVTRSEAGEAHPHFHVLMLVPAGYFTGKGYVKQETWRQTWQECLRVNYLPVVNVKAVKAKKAASEATHPDREQSPTQAEIGFSPESCTRSDTATEPKIAIEPGIARAICETLKYSVKESDLAIDSNWLSQLTSQLNGTKAVSVGGELKRFLREEKDNDDLVHIDENGITTDDEKDPSIWFGWREAIKHYAKTER